MEEVHRQHVEALRSMTRQQRLSRALEVYEAGLKLAEVGRRARGTPRGAGTRRHKVFCGRAE